MELSDILTEEEIEFANLICSHSLGNVSSWLGISKKQARRQARSIAEKLSSHGLPCDAVLSFENDCDAMDLTRSYRDDNGNELPERPKCLAFSDLEGDDLGAAVNQFGGAEVRRYSN